MLLENSRRYMTFAAPTMLAANTIIFSFCDGALLKSLYKMAASSKDKRTPSTTPPYQVPSADVTPDPLLSRWTLPLIRVGAYFLQDRLGEKILKKLKNVNI
jgi:hypothetical protein